MQSVSLGKRVRGNVSSEIPSALGAEIEVGVMTVNRGRSRPSSEGFALHQHFPRDHFNFQDLAQVFEGGRVSSLFCRRQECGQENVEIGLLPSQGVRRVNDPGQQFRKDFADEDNPLLGPLMIPFIPEIADRHRQGMGSTEKQPVEFGRGSRCDFLLQKTIDGVGCRHTWVFPHGWRSVFDAWL